jgi:predicted RNase H-like nuclease
MKLDNILSITGKPGLYILKTKAKSGFVVESLIDKKTSIIGMNHNVSVLKDISIYTETAEVSLKEVLSKIAAEENNEQALSHKVSKEELQSYFTQILPDYDKDRVYASDIKKVVQWYNILQANDLLSSLKEEE